MHQEVRRHTHTHDQELQTLRKFAADEDTGSVMVPNRMCREEPHNLLIEKRLEPPSLVLPGPNCEFSLSSGETRTRYGLLMGRLKRTIAQPLQKQAAHRYLTSLIREALSLATTVHRHLKQSSALSSDADRVNVQTLTIIDAAEKLLDRFDRQQRILLQLKDNALNLCALIEEMPRERPPNYADLLNLADYISQQVAQSNELSDFLAQPGLPKCEILAGELPTQHTSVYIDAIQSAQLVSWMTKGDLGPVIRKEEVVVAALLQDVGRLALKPGLCGCVDHCPPVRRCLYCKHPQSSAAMIGRMHQPPIAVARLVARHHERLDGSGFPLGYAGIQLNESVRALTVAVETVSLSQSPISQSRFVQEPVRGWSELSTALRLAAAQQELDTNWTHHLAVQLEKYVAKESRDQFQAVAEDRELAQAPGRHTLHGHHVQIPNPHEAHDLSTDVHLLPNSTASLSD